LRGALPDKNGYSDLDPNTGKFTGCKCDPIFPGGFINPLDSRIIYDEPAAVMAATIGIPPIINPKSVKQLRPNGDTITTRESITDSTVAFRAILSHPTGKNVKLQVELRRLDEYDRQFDDTKGGLKESDLVESGKEATAYAYGLIDGDYHWRARAVCEDGTTDDWVDFGDNDISEADFTVSAEQTYDIEQESALPSGNEPMGTQEFAGTQQETAIEQPVNKQLPSGASIVQLATGPLSDGRPQSLAIDTEGKLWTCWMTRLNDDSSWTDWIEDPMRPSGVYALQAEAIPLSDGRLRFWIKDASGTLWMNQKLNTYANAGWTGWIEIALIPQFTEVSSANIEQPVNKQLPSGASIVKLATGPLSDGRPQSWAVDTDGKLWTCWMTRLNDGSSWTGWIEDPMLSSGVYVSQAEAIPLSDGRLRIWIKDANGTLWLNQKLTTYSNAGWTGWIEIGILPKFAAS
jgi:hypothetical protein